MFREQRPKHGALVDRHNHRAQSRQEISDGAGQQKEEKRGGRKKKKEREKKGKKGKEGRNKRNKGAVGHKDAAPGALSGNRLDEHSCNWPNVFGAMQRLKATGHSSIFPITSALLQTCHSDRSSAPISFPPLFPLLSPSFPTVLFLSLRLHTLPTASRMAISDMAPSE